MKKIILFLIIFFAIAFSYSQNIAVLKTNYGNIKIRLYKSDAPKTVKNFIRYAKADKYKDAVFYRIAKGFVIQSGAVGYKNNQVVERKEYPSIKSEADNGLYNIKKTIAMARLGKDPNSATSHFFINLKSNSRLNYGTTKDLKKSYTVFGKVFDGWDVVKQIANIDVYKKEKYEKFPKKIVRIKDVVIKNLK